MRPKLIAIVGPTASGKTSLGISLAKKFGGQIISADSRQVYRGLDIGTGKITKREMRGIPHYLLDVVSPRSVFTVMRYQKLGRAAIKNILKKGKLPVVVGGTGLYIDALVYNYNFPSVKPDPALREKLESQSVEKLYAQLKKLDPRRAATIDPRNPRRLVRALEIVISTRQPVPSREELLDRSSDHDMLLLGIDISEKKLYANIHRRLLARLCQGMIREVKVLHGQGLSWKRLDDLGLEYRYIGRCLQGLLTKEEMLDQLEKEIRQFSKRQMTWFRKNKNIVWVKNEKEAEKKLRGFL